MRLRRNDRGSSLVWRDQQFGDRARQADRVLDGIGDGADCRDAALDSQVHFV